MVHLPILNSDIYMQPSKKIIIKPKIGIPIMNKKYSDYLRLKIYSFLEFEDLIFKISILSKKEKELLVSKSELLD